MHSADPVNRFMTTPGFLERPRDGLRTPPRMIRNVNCAAQVSIISADNQAGEQLNSQRGNTRKRALPGATANAQRRFASMARRAAIRSSRSAAWWVADYPGALPHPSEA